MVQKICAVPFPCISDLQFINVSVQWSKKYVQFHFFVEVTYNFCYFTLLCRSLIIPDKFVTQKRIIT